MLALLALLSLAPLPLRALPYGSLDWVDYDPAYRQGCSWPVPASEATGAQAVCGELPEQEPPAPAPQLPTTEPAVASPRASGGQTPTPEPSVPSPQAPDRPAPSATMPVPSLQIPCAEMPEGDEPLVAIVSGQEIGRAAFDREMDQFLRAVEAGGSGMASTEIQARLPEFRRQVLELLIGDVLIQQAAVEAGIAVSEESVEAQLAAQVEEGGGLELFQAWLEQTGQTWAEVRHDTCQELLVAKVQGAMADSAAESEADQQAAAFQRWLEERRGAADVQVLVDLEH